MNKKTENKAEKKSNTKTHAAKHSASAGHHPKPRDAEAWALVSPEVAATAAVDPGVDGADDAAADPVDLTPEQMPDAYAALDRLRSRAMGVRRRRSSRAGSPSASR